MIQGGEHNSRVRVLDSEWGMSCHPLAVSRR
jgi:hypothetical protein